MEMLLLLATLITAGEKRPASRWDFHDAPVGRLPPGWVADRTGEGAGSEWTVIDDKTAPKGNRVLAQTSADAPNSLFNLCVAKESKFKDLDLTVSFKAVHGAVDQGGGPVWRYQDANNYYVARMNPLEKNFRVYKVINGKRIQLQSSNVEGATGKWHTIRVVHRGSHIQCHLNGKLQLDVKDESLQNTGRIGVWTKADAQTYFTNVIVTIPQEKNQLKSGTTSGPQPGTTIPGPFFPVIVHFPKDPIFVGKRMEFVEEGFGPRPVILVFARRLSEPQTSLFKRIDAKLAKHKEMRGIVVWLSSFDEELSEKLTSPGRTQALDHLILTIHDMPGPKGYNVATEADLTIVLYDKRKVLDNHAYRFGEFNENAVEQVINAIDDKLVRRSK